MFLNTLPGWFWFLICLTQRWYVAPTLIMLLGTQYTALVEDTLNGVCTVPGYLYISSSFICRLVHSRQRILGEAGVAPVPASHLDTLQDVLVHSFFSKDITSADLSIGDITFLVESSRMDRHDLIAGTFNRLKEQSILLTGHLLELRAETSYHVEL